MKRVFLVLVALLIVGLAYSNPVDVKLAQKIAKTFLESKSSESVELIDISKASGFSKFYIFNRINGKGFVIVSADDRVQSILAYSNDNNFVTDNMPMNLIDWLMGYEIQIQAAINEDIETPEYIIEEWNNLSHGIINNIKTTESVGPLISTKWGQGNHNNPTYNALCPTSYLGLWYTYTGCAATAMAQVMKYWEYPIHGQGYHSYNCSYYGTQSANFANTYYDWNNMPNQLTVNSTSSQINAVATIMYHCGVSIDMDYGYNASGADPSLHAQALINYFKYATTTRFVRKSDYSPSAWIDLLKNELNNNRPVLYNGYGDSGGHSFICDGYDNDDKFYFNWGWNGDNDGAYSLLDLTPGTGGTGAGSGSYTANQSATIGIQPSYNNEPELVMYSSLYIADAWFGSDITGTIQVLNEGATYSGYLGVIIFNDNDVAVSGQLFNVNDLPCNYYATGNISIEGGVPLIPGFYYAVALYSEDGDNWNIVQSTSSAYNDKVFEVYYSAQMETYSGFSETILIQGRSNTINVDILNDGSTTFYGKVRVSLANIGDGSHVQTIGIVEINNGLQPNYHYTNGLDFTGTITAEPGTYLLSLAYQRNGESTWYYAGSSYYSNPIFATVVAAPTLSVSPTSLTFPLSGGSKVVEITTNVNWSAHTSASWLTISPNSGTESGYIVVNASVNNTNSSRQGTITVSGGNGVTSKTIVVTQAGPMQYYIEVNSANPNMGYVTGSGTYASGSTATIKAIPYSGYRFVRWQDNNTQNPRNITVTTNATYTAYFEPILDVEDVVDNRYVKINVEDGGVIIIVDDKLLSYPLKIYDLLGRVVVTKEISDTHNYFSLPAGVYLITIADYPSQKVVITR